MISETQAARSYVSFWRNALPFADRFVRQMNVQLEHFQSPSRTELPPDRNALVSEIGFRLFRESIFLGNYFPTSGDLNGVLLGDIVHESWRYISQLERAGFELLPASEYEIEEALLLANQLSNFFINHEKTSNIIISPHFKGCGIIDRCYGDAIADNTLYEIKNVERFFRITDLRQILIYFALNYEAIQYQVTNICLLNPKHGRLYRTSLELLCRSVSGQNSSELLASIIHFFSIDSHSG